MRMKTAINKIAREHLLINSLELRGLDRLDFRDLHVGSIRRALEAAYKASVASQNGKRRDAS